MSRHFASARVRAANASGARRQRRFASAGCLAWLAGFALQTAFAQMPGAVAVDDRVNVYEVVVADKPQSVLSFLPKEHVFAHGLAGASIIGSLRVRIADGGEVEPGNLVVNPAFVELMHRVIETHAPRDPAFQRAAREQGEGWMYVIDRRTPTPGGHVPAEDIIGSFQIEKGEPLPGSYRPFKSHRLMSERGLVQLDPHLHPKLMAELMALRSAEP